MSFHFVLFLLVNAKQYPYLLNRTQPLQDDSLMRYFTNKKMKYFWDQNTKTFEKLR